MRLYHCNRRRLNIGDIVQPGNYGQIISEYGEQHPSWERETFLENARKLNYPTKPSRLNSCFGCEDLEVLRQYRNLNAKTDHIYFVEVCDKTAKSHKADYNCLQPIPGKDLDTWDDVVRGYWEGSWWSHLEHNPNVKCIEVLVESALQVIDVVEYVEANSK